jgi:hypothetical protein
LGVVQLVPRETQSVNFFCDARCTQHGTSLQCGLICIVWLCRGCILWYQASAKDKPTKAAKPVASEKKGVRRDIFNGGVWL